MLYLLEEDSIVGVETLQKCDEVLCTHDQRLLRLFTHKYLHIPAQFLARKTGCLRSRLLKTLCIAVNCYTVILFSPK